MDSFLDNLEENQKIELEGVIEWIMFRNEKNGYTVISLDIDDDNTVSCVGTMPEVSLNEEVKIIGRIKSHPKYGMQIAVDSIEKVMPSSADAIISYLTSGAVSGIGKKLAEKLVETFGEQTLEILEKSPEKVAELRGFSEEKAKSISEQLKQNFGYKELAIALSRYGLKPAEIVRVWRALGTDALNIVEENPYVLCDDEIRISFDRADAIAAGQPDSVDIRFRIRAAIVHTLKHNLANGFTCSPRDRLTATFSNFYDVDSDTADKILGEMIDDGSLCSELRSSDETELISLPDYHEAEVYAAGRLLMLLRFPPPVINDIDGRIGKIEKECGITYADRQKQAITAALKQGVLVLTGGPGTGKTTTLNAIIKILTENGEKVALAAPTGRAAKRMSELTGCEAMTLHRLLEVEWSEDEKPEFRRNEQNTLECDALIIDEVSMIDSLLLESVMKAFPLGCRLILVGDSDQLPSVGPGNVLGDIIASEKLPVISLNEIFRQSMESLIVSNAHRINSGEMPIIDKTDRDFFFMRRANSAQVEQTVVELCKTRLPRTYGLSVMNTLQVLSPCKTGPIGTKELNKKIQNAVNPQDGKKPELNIFGQTLRLGDKVMQTKNNYYIPWDKPDGTMGEGVFNGDIGILTDIDVQTRELRVQFDDKTAKYLYENAYELELAYCTTVHKSQGNEFKAVIIPLMNTPEKLLYRNLLYTAVTRARELLIIVGNPAELERMVDNNRKTLRFTMLKELLRR